MTTKLEDLRETIGQRSRLLACLRSFFDARDFIEVQTPSLVLAPDPAPHLDSFQTIYHDPSGRIRHLYLPTSPEHHMKRMLAAGFERIYQIDSFYRDGELGPLHNPEFTGLEWYEAGASMEDTMDLTEALVRHAAQTLCGGLPVSRQGHQLDLSKPFARVTVREALMRWAQVDVPEDWDEEALRRALVQAGYRLSPDDGFDDLVNRPLIERVEPALAELGPAFLTDYPAPMAALARLRPSAPAVAERFELYIGGLELSNGYGELSDAKEQRRRFKEQLTQRHLMGKADVPLDEAFLQALSQGMPAAGGNALGVDRLLMLLLDKARIEQVMAFSMAEELGWGAS